MGKKFSFIILALAISLAAFAVASRADAQQTDCGMCHSAYTQGKSVHAAVNMGCAVCHSGVDASSIPHKFKGGPRGLSSQAPDLCFMCHDKGKFSGKKVVHMPVAGGMCTSCHSPHTSESEHLLLSEKVCFNCHDAKPFGRKDVHPPVQAGACSSCHNPHQSDTAKLLKEQSPDLCYECHNKEDFYGPTIHAPVGIGECSLCHDPHSSDNGKLLSAAVPDICFMCHAKASFFLKSVHKPVVEGKCTECHRPHASQNEFLLERKGNFICRKCHIDVEKGAHAVAAFSRKGHPLSGRRDPVREGKTFGCVSCHLPHTSESPLLFRYKADNMFDLCAYCHRM